MTSDDLGPDEMTLKEGERTRIIYLATESSGRGLKRWLKWRPHCIHWLAGNNVESVGVDCVEAPPVFQCQFLTLE